MPAGPAWSATSDSSTTPSTGPDRLVSALSRRPTSNATALDRWDAGAVRSAGALGYVPKAAGPRHTELALRAAASGQEYVHPDVTAGQESSSPVRITLSPREQRLAELYLGSAAMSVRGVADTMGISEQTVKAHLHRIRQRYATAGIKLGNVISLRKQLANDGWIS